MRFSIEPREIRYIKGYGFLSFARNIGKNISNKYGQKIAGTARKSETSRNSAIKTASKTAIPKAAGATGDLIGNNIADKITSTSKKSLKKPRHEKSSSTEVNKEIPEKRYISPKERQQIIDELILI